MHDALSTTAAGIPIPTPFSYRHPYYTSRITHILPHRHMATWCTSPHETTQPCTMTDWHRPWPWWQPFSGHSNPNQPPLHPLPMTPSTSHHPQVADLADHPCVSFCASSSLLYPLADLFLAMGLQVDSFFSMGICGSHTTMVHALCSPVAPADLKKTQSKTQSLQSTLYTGIDPNTTTKPSTAFSARSHAQSCGAAFSHLQRHHYQVKDINDQVKDRQQMTIKWSIRDLRTMLILDMQAQASLQGTNYHRIFVDSSRHQIHLRFRLRTIALPIMLIMRELQHGSSKAAYIRIENQ